VEAGIRIFKSDANFLHFGLPNSSKRIPGQVSRGKRPLDIQFFLLPSAKAKLAKSFGLRYPRSAMSSENDSAKSTLSRETIVRGMQLLSDLLGKQGVTGEICLFGGAVMVLAFSARLATKDVDAIFRPAQTIRDIASRVAEHFHLPADWLNDGVKSFVSKRHDTTPGNLPQFPHLRLTMPVPEYLLAMKCMASRLGGTADEPSDVSDIIFLIRRLNLKTAGEVLGLVELYYPANRIPVKTRYLIEGLFDEGRI
jgi:hypothetical protein